MKEAKRKGTNQAIEKARDQNRAFVTSCRIHPETYVDHPVVAETIRLGHSLRRLMQEREDTWASPHYAQLNRSLASVGANLVEGLAKGGGQETVRFMKTAMGSAMETVYWSRYLELEEEVFVELVQSLQGVCIDFVNSLDIMQDACQVMEEEIVD